MRIEHVELGVDLRHTRLGGAVIDHGQGLAFAHRVTGLHQQLSDPPTGLGRQHTLLHRLQAAVEQQTRHRTALTDHHHGHLRATGCRCRGFVTRASAQSAHRQQSHCHGAGATLAIVQN